MKIGFAQLNTTVGDLRGNTEKILNAYRDAVSRGAELVLTPELAITGYPPQDLVFKSRFVSLNLEMLDFLQKEIGDVPGNAPLVVGFVAENQHRAGRPFYNAAAILQRGKPAQIVHKSQLPAYDVFDEYRYFEPGESSAPITISELSKTADAQFGVTICEDIWTEAYLPRRLYGASPIENLVAQNARILLNISASPFCAGKPQNRFEMLSAIAKKHGIPIFYCNAVGGNDQLVFDGNSLAIDANGDLIAQLPAFEETVAVIDSDAPAIAPKFLSEPEEIHRALVLGLRDYAQKCGFKSAVLGLSGGIDSAVSAAIAVSALGAENVLGVAMPTRFSSQHSIDDALALAENLGIRCLQIPIQPSFEAVKAQFAEIFAGRDEDVAEENIQPRLRAITLMAISNKFGHLLLTTGNKSELAVGYCTIYGDMAGGLAVISDVPKTKIYALARWMNRDREIIPLNTIEKPPSAELKPDQTDQDTLPLYEILDEILRLYVEENLTAADIIANHHFDEPTVRWVTRRVDLNEWKRKQAAPGIKVTSLAFGVGRRMPVAQRFVD